MRPAATPGWRRGGGRGPAPPSSAPTSSSDRVPCGDPRHILALPVERRISRPAHCSTSAPEMSSIRFEKSRSFRSSRRTRILSVASRRNDHPERAARFGTNESFRSPGDAQCETDLSREGGSVSEGERPPTRSAVPRCRPPQFSLRPAAASGSARSKRCPRRTADPGTRTRASRRRPDWRAPPSLAHEDDPVPLVPQEFVVRRLRVDEYLVAPGTLERASHPAGHRGERLRLDRVEGGGRGGVHDEDLVREAVLLDRAAAQRTSPWRLHPSRHPEGSPPPISPAMIVPPVRKAFPGGVCPSEVSSQRSGIPRRNSAASPALHSTRIVPSASAPPTHARRYPVARERMPHTRERIFSSSRTPTRDRSTSVINSNRASRRSLNRNHWPERRKPEARSREMKNSAITTGCSVNGVIVDQEGRDHPDRKKPLQKRAGRRRTDTAETAGREKHDGLPRGDELEKAETLWNAGSTIRSSTPPVFFRERLPPSLSAGCARNFKRIFDRTDSTRQTGGRRSLWRTDPEIVYCRQHRPTEMRMTNGAGAIHREGFTLSSVWLVIGLVIGLWLAAEMIYPALNLRRGSRTGACAWSTQRADLRVHPRRIFACSFYMLES